MPKMTVVINDELDKKFKEEIFKDKGMKRGNIQEAVEEAIQMWIKEKSSEDGRKND